jgi:hypothetical protein
MIEQVNKFIKACPVSQQRPFTFQDAIDTAHVLLVVLGSLLTPLVGLNGQYFFTVQYLTKHCGDSADNAKEFLHYLHHVMFAQVGSRFLNIALNPLSEPDSADGAANLAQLNSSLDRLILTESELSFLKSTYNVTTLETLRAVDRTFMSADLVGKIELFVKTVDNVGRVDSGTCRIVEMASTAQTEVTNSAALTQAPCT